MIDMRKPYLLDISIIKNNPNTLYPLMVKFTQDKTNGERFECAVTVNATEYRFSYSMVATNPALPVYARYVDGGVMIIMKDYCDTDVLFQMSTVHPFTVSELVGMLAVVDGVVV
jgi:hypothetical protein